MFRWLFLLIVIVPALEIGILIGAGKLIGAWWVVLLIISTGALGAYLAKSQGLDTINRARQNVSNGIIPHDELIDGLCILIGAVVLLTPGFITDTFGFLLLFPATRYPIKKWLKLIIRKMLNNGTITIFRG